MSLIKNASPQVILLGADDKSKGVIYPSSDPVPQHCPLFFIFARKGTTTKQLIGSSKFTSLYGDETFDANDKYFNHATRFLSAIAGTGNVCMVQRVIPDDAGVRSNANVYIDVLETKVPNYVRNSLGDLVTDPITNKAKVDETTPTIDGYKIRFIKESLTEETEFGLLTTKTGTMSEEVTYIPEIKDNVQFILNNWLPLIKVGDPLPIYDLTSNLPTTDVRYEITSSNPVIVDFDPVSLKYVGKATGNVDIGLKVYDAREDVADEDKMESISFTIPIRVQEEGVLPVSETPLTVTGIVQTLTPEVPSMKLTISDASATIAVVGDASIVSIDNATKTITALKNGEVMITVTKAATEDNCAQAVVFTVQSKITSNEAVTELRTSTMYPLFEAKAKYQGEAYDNIGFSIGSLYNDEVSSDIVSDTKSLPYKLALYTRDTDVSSPTVLRSLYGEPSVNFTFKEKAINPSTDARFDFEYVYANNWYNETDNLKQLRYFDYDNIYFYRNNFELVTKKFLDKEKEYISNDPVEWSDGEFAATSSWFDFTTDDKTAIMDETYLINPFAAKSSKNVKYFTLMQSDLSSSYKDGQKEVTFSTDTPIFLEGGSDGTLSNEKYEELVVSKMNDYLDEDSEVQDLAINVESVFYDTGFTLETKKSLVNFVTLRKDTRLVLTTHDAQLGEKDLPLSDARAVAVALKTSLNLAPESEYFGTGVCRAIVVMGTYTLRDGTTSDRIPISYDIAMKSAKMMGASTGNWKAAEMFDNYPGNTLSYGINPTPGFIPASIKPTLWSDGIIWVQPYDRASYHFPAIQTVYDDDTSALNNFFTVAALCETVKCSDRIWRKFTGTSGLTNSVFLEKVTAAGYNEIKDKFGGIITVIPSAVMTDEDVANGFSWRFCYKIYSPNMKTVMTAWSEVYRLTDDMSS